MCPHGYYTLMRESQDPKMPRLRMARFAQKSGVKPAAREFSVTARTVRKWLGRFDGTLDSLASLSRRPHRSPNKLSKEAEEEIVAARNKMQVYSAKRLRRDMNLPYSAGAIYRVLREKHLVRRWRRKKQEVKRCLRAVKKLLPLWKMIMVDTKHLYDMPEYLAQMKLLGLPKYQHTARDVSTGAVFLAFSDELSITYSELFIKRIAELKKERAKKACETTVQTDNGSEFIGSWLSNEASAFTRAVESFGWTHRTIPPGAHRFQADVETVHSLMEIEFYLERFESRADFLAKAATYQDFFNYARPNSGKEDKCPFDLILEKDLTAPLDLLYLPPVFLEDELDHRLHPQRGYDVPVTP